MSSFRRLNLRGGRMARIAALLAFGDCALLWAAPAAAVIYKFVDEQGRVHFQDHPPQGSVSGLEERESLPSAPVTPSAPAAPGPAVRQEAAGAAVTQPPTPRREPQVELYGVAWCPWCRKAREFFRSRGVQISYYDIEKDAAAAARKSGMDSKKGVPFAVVNGVRIHGYSEEAYSRALQPR